MRRAFLTAFASLAFWLGAACSSVPDRCLAVAPGTHIDSLPLLRGPTDWCTSACSAQSSNVEGDALLCCTSAKDGGCGVNCSTLPPVSIYEIGGEYAGGRCDDNVGMWQCGAWVRDGGVVATFLTCSD
jgi:hypothetical protein